MFREIRDHIINIVTSRLTVLMISFCFFCRCSALPLFQPADRKRRRVSERLYPSDQKTVDISSTRGRIPTGNGNVLQENELAYS